MRRTTGLALSASVLLGVLAGCGSDAPAGTLTQDQVKGAQKGGKPPVFTRRIIVPLEDRVVIVGVLLEGSDDFTVTPEDLLDDAAKAAPDAKIS